MKLEWIGHSCFRMTAEDGTVVVVDPYDESVGNRMLPLEAALVTISHEHHDHNYTGMLRGAPQIVRELDPAQAGGVFTCAYPSYHDDMEGAMRGKNAIRAFEMDGVRLVHMGDVGCMPQEDVIAAVSDADVMMIPVGGYYTVDAAQAQRIIERTRPRCVVPMHFHTTNGLYDAIAGVTPFLELMGAHGVLPVRSLTVDAEHAPGGIVLMQPLSDELCPD